MKKDDRICFLEDDPFEHDFRFEHPQKADLSRGVDSLDDFYDTVIEAKEKLDGIAELKSDYETILRCFRIGNIRGTGAIRGICLKSFPLPPKLMYYVELICLCKGGEHGVSMVHLPRSGGILDQDFRFLEFFKIYTSEESKVITKHMREKSKAK